MNSLRRIWFPLLCAALTLLSVGCQKMVEKSLVGKWRSTTSGSTMEFYPDHTAQLSLGPLKLAGSYTMLEDDRLKVEVKAPLGITTVRTWKTKLDGDTLTVTDENGTPDTLTRQPSQ